LAWRLAASASRAQTPRLVCLDLQPKANAKLTDGESNSLAAFPKREQTFAGVKFKIKDGLILLADELDRESEKVEGIKVGTTCSKLHFLHACNRSTKEGDIIGYYTVNYEDKARETIAFVYGKDLANWWYGLNHGTPSRTRVA
jgi:hypothetical protein